MIRSFWKVPRSAWLDEDGNPPGNVVVYDESPQFIFCIAAEEERPDLEAIGTLLGNTVKSMKVNDRARFLRIEVERDTPATENEPASKVLVQVKAKDKKPGDVEKRIDIPAVIWAGDDPADYLP